MGVAGLWKILQPAGITRSLTELSVEGFVENSVGIRGYRLGIDASIWFVHAMYGRGGENPGLRVLFYRCATLMRCPFLPLFVFDGPNRPEYKRGQKVNTKSHSLVSGMKKIVEAFGFAWIMAPGEAEAELAYLNRIGIIDGILSDDVDTFLFGAVTVIRKFVDLACPAYIDISRSLINPSVSPKLASNCADPARNASGKTDKNHSKIYQIKNIAEHPKIGLNRAGMILIGLLKGGDYHPGGLQSCGVITAHGLAKCGFGDTLCHAAENLNRESLIPFLVSWRNEVRQELLTDSQGYIGQKNPKLADAIPESFPSIDILLSYTNPLTSEFTSGSNHGFTWETEPDLRKLAAICETYFEWGYAAAIVKRFRTVIWCPIVLRILRRAVIQLDSGIPQGLASPFNGLGTSTSYYFSSLYTSTTEEPNLNSQFLIKIHSARRHVSTDKVLEYQLEILPIQFISITESGIRGSRTPPAADITSISALGKEEKGKGRVAPDPKSSFKAWMPACMVQIVEPGLVAEYEAKAGSVSSSSGGRARGPYFKGPPSIRRSIVIFPRDRKKLSGATLISGGGGDGNNDLSMIDDSPANVIPCSSPTIFRPSLANVGTQVEVIIVSSDSESEDSKRLGKGRKRKGHPSGRIHYKFPKIHNIVKEVIDLT